MKQLFEVGEIVLLKQSHQECTVLEVKYEKDIEVTGCEGLHSIFCYRIGVIGPNGFDYWIESALCKKQEPSELSFRQLMTTLKSPQKVEWE